VKVECGNCDWVGDDDAEGFTPLEECCDLTERLEAGSVVPAGDCPECRAFCYIVKEDEVVDAKIDITTDLNYALDQLRKSKAYGSCLAKEDCIQRALDALERIECEVLPVQADRVRIEQKLVDTAEKAKDLNLYCVSYFWAGRDEEPTEYLVRCARLPTEDEVIQACRIEFEAGEEIIILRDSSNVPIIDTEEAT